MAVAAGQAGRLGIGLLALGGSLAATSSALAAHHSTHIHASLVASGLAAAFLFGLLGSTHCFGMCGPLVSLYASQLIPGSGPSPVRQHLLFNLGRLLAYTNLGVLFGAAGFLLSVRPWTVGLVGLAAGLFVLAMGGHYGQAIGLFVFCSLVVGGLDNFLRPRLVGQDTRMHELLILFGTLGGLLMFGPVGIIIGPIVSALVVTVWEIYAVAFKESLPGTGLPIEDDPAENADSRILLAADPSDARKS